MHLKRRRIHFRVLKLDPGEELRHARESISFSAESYITDPPFPPDRMTYVIYHMGPSQTRGGEGRGSPVHVMLPRPPPPPPTVHSTAGLQRERESTADLARGRGRREETQGRREESLLRMDGWACGGAGTRLAEAWTRLCSFILSAQPLTLF